MGKLDDRNRKWILWMFVSAFLLMACEKQNNRGAQTGAKIKAEMETKIEEKENPIDILTAYTTEIEYSDQEISSVYTDDRSLLDHMGQGEFSYAYQDGMVYYRQYHKDSFEEGAVWGNYGPTVGTYKEIVSIDPKGEKTVLFSDKGYGNIYLIGDRFYMTEKKDEAYSYPNIYSVDRNGQNRVDYGYGDVCAFDMDRKVLILQMLSEEKCVATYFALECESNEMTELQFDSFDCLTFQDYYDGWCYFDAHKKNGIKACQVVGISLEGEQKKMIALASDEETGVKYRQDAVICDMEVVGDRMYILFGNYTGSAHHFQGGRLITTKLDGSDYHAIEREVDNDDFYACQNGGRNLVYFGGRVWDLDANTIFSSDFGGSFDELKRHRIVPYQEQSFLRLMWTGWGSDSNGRQLNVYALENSGRIIKVATGIDEAIIQREDEKEYDEIEYNHLYYADGFLYFEVEFKIIDRTYAIGWRDGYRRVQTDVYRMKLEEKSIELLYSY